MSSLSYSQKLVVNECLAERMDEYLELLGLDLKRKGNTYYGCCPVHDGDNPLGFRLYIDGHTSKNNWVCFTRGCRGGIFQLTAAVKKCTEYQAEEFVLSFLGMSRSAIKRDKSLEKKLEFLRRTRTLTQEYIEGKGWDKSVLNRLDIPSRYFLRRGVERSILNRFYVGDSIKMNRAVAPIFNCRDRVVSYTARTFYEKCGVCGNHHKSGQCAAGTPKWFHPKDMSIHNHLYNYWNAKPHILEKRYVVLVEGTGDVWKLEQFGEKNTVALFGCNIYEPQEILLQKSGALRVYLALDNDKAGDKGRTIIREKCKRMFDVIDVSYDGGDIGSVTDKEAKRIIGEFK